MASLDDGPLFCPMSRHRLGRCLKKPPRLQRQATLGKKGTNSPMLLVTNTRFCEETDSSCAVAVGLTSTPKFFIIQGSESKQTRFDQRLSAPLEGVRP
jgi:hypothetical protein